MSRHETDDDDPTAPLGRYPSANTRPDGTDSQPGLRALPEPLRFQLVETGEEIPLGDEAFTIGRSTENRIVLPDISVSRVQCRVTPLGDEAYIESLAPKNWVKVNDEEVLHQYLRTGDRLQLGSTTLRLLAGDFDAAAIHRYGIVGRSAAMERVRERIARVAPRSETVLILGETGTGKELVAAALHLQSGRRGPFIPVNCAAIKAELAEAEFFGYEEGAFTGAARGGRDGKFVQAEGGTLFLDEIGDLDPAIQAMILRAAEDKMIRRIQGRRERSVDVRIVVATNADLRTPIYVGMGSGKDDEFRRDLYERLASAKIVLPPLRKRMEDLPFLITHFREKLGEKRPLTSDAYQRMSAYAWPDNVRELLRRLTQASIFGEGRTIGVDDLFPPKEDELQHGPAALGEQRTGAAAKSERKTLPPIAPPLASRGRLSDDQIREALERYGSPAEAARATGIHRTTFYRYMRKLRGSEPGGDDPEEDG